VRVGGDTEYSKKAMNLMGRQGKGEAGVKLERRKKVWEVEVKLQVGKEDPRNFPRSEGAWGKNVRAFLHYHPLLLR
jgi:hypothetical protein